MTLPLPELYHQVYEDTLLPIAKKLECFLSDLLRDFSRIDRISARAKTPDRFLGKAKKCNLDGTAKYADPISEIQDQVGARIIVFYKSDSQAVKDYILRYLTAIEVQSKEPSNESEFGYFGTHLILDLPDDAVPEKIGEYVPSFFELQIKTLFQHAWSEAHHDLGYKASDELTSDQKRKIAFSAAQAWGSDEIFNELFRDVSNNLQ